MGLNMSVLLSRAVCGKGPFSLLITRDVEVKIQARVGTSSPPLKGNPSRSPLSADLILQTRYSPVPLNNQSFLPLKVASQPMALLGQAFNRACSLGRFATSSIKQRRLITQLVSSNTQLFPSCPQLVMRRLQLILDSLKLSLGSLQPVPGLQQVLLGSLQPILDFSKLDLGYF